MDITEKNTYLELFRRGNQVYVSIRRNGEDGHHKGAVSLQYIVKLEDLLKEISEDVSERSTTTTS